MNAQTKRWQSYVDDAGRRHWRWPAVPQLGTTPAGSNQQALADRAQLQQQAAPLPLRVRSR